MTPVLSSIGEDEWRRFKTHLELSNGFCLCFFFSAHPEVVDAFRDRFAQISKAHLLDLRIYDPKQPEDLVNDILPRMLTPKRFKQTAGAPVWLDLAAQSGVEWGAARFNLLARLNEQREPLRRRRDHPIILVLPLSDKQRVRELVPDLWSIRNFTLETDASHLSTYGLVSPTPTPDEPSPLPLSVSDKAALKEWERVRTKKTRDRGVFLAGIRAFDVLYRTRRLDDAEHVARELDNHSLAFIEKEGETPEGTRDRSLALAFVKRLELRHRLLQIDDETSESLHDLSVSLEKLGETFLALDRLEDAAKAFKDGLHTKRKLHRIAGETPDSLRDISVSLNRIGETEMSMGHFEEARLFSNEGLEISRSLATTFSDQVEYNQLVNQLNERLQKLDDEELSKLPENIGVFKRRFFHFNDVTAIEYSKKPCFFNLAAGKDIDPSDLLFIVYSDSQSDAIRQAQTRIRLPEQVRNDFSGLGTIQISTTVTAVLPSGEERHFKPFDIVHIWKTEENLQHLAIIATNVKSVYQLMPDAIESTLNQAKNGPFPHAIGSHFDSRKLVFSGIVFLYTDILNVSWDEIFRFFNSRNMEIRLRDDNFRKREHEEA